jgi:rod shape-determining protein MreC
LIDVRQQNVVLGERLDELEGRNALLAELQHENNQLRELLAMKKERPMEGVVAKVIGYDPSKWVRAVVIDKGKRDGLMNGMPVVNVKGVVGQIVAVSLKTARVLLISDHASGLDVIIQNDTRSRGVVEGSGGNSCELQYVTREEEVRVGDRLVTSGMDGIYPKGLLVGSISNFSSGMGSLFHRIEVKPVVDFDALETVFIVVSKGDE